MKQYNAHLNLQLSQPTPAEKLRKMEKNKRRILATQKETSREVVLKNSKSKESLDTSMPPASIPVVVASTPAPKYAPSELDKVSSKKSEKISDEMCDDFLQANT